ncbi:hypothetical protein Tco_0934150 [Tanacetum coccineum]
MTCGTELTDGVCLQCCPYPNYYDNTPNYSDYPPQPEYQTYSCEYNRNFDCFPHDSQTLPQQYLCCENCGGPHETYQCQPMNQEYYNSHSSGFDQFQPPQFSDVYQTPPVTSMEMLHAQTDLIEAMQDFLKKYDHIPHNEKSIKLLLALAGRQFSARYSTSCAPEAANPTPEVRLFLLMKLYTPPHPTRLLTLRIYKSINEIQPLKQENFYQIQKRKIKKRRTYCGTACEERLQFAQQSSLKMKVNLLKK